MTDRRSLWHLDPEVTFLNHGSFGACPIPVLEHQAELRLAMERRPVEFLTDALEEALDSARRSLGGFVTADPAGVVFVPNATTGAQAVFGSLRLEPGDEILVTDHGYNACRVIAGVAAARSGATLRTVPIPFAEVTKETVLDRVLAAAGTRTRLVVVDHVTSPTALVLPVERIVAELEPAGIRVLVDGAHAPGMLPLAVDALGASYYVGNCHKWMGAPKGAGFLVAAPDVRDELLPAVLSHGHDSPRTDRSRYHLRFDWTGTDDPTAWLAVPKAIEVMGALLPGGWDALRRANRDLTLTGRQIIADAVGAGGLPDAGMLGSMAAIPLRPDPNERDPRGRDPLALTLRHRHRIEVPVSAWPAAPARMLRISAQAYNRPDDYEHLAAALVAEGIRGAD